MTGVRTSGGDRAWRRAAAVVILQWLALSTLAQEAPLKLPPQRDRNQPQTVFSTSRRFTITGFSPATAVDLARWADDVADRLAQLTGPQPWPRGDYLEIAAAPEAGAVTKSQGIADGRLQQRLWLGVADDLDQEDALEALVWLLLNRHVIYAQSPAVREQGLGGVPDWLAVGLAQNLYHELRQRNVRFGVDRWLRGEQLSLSALDAREVMPRGRWMEKVDAGLTMSWLLSLGRPWQSCWDRMADGAAKPIAWCALAMSGCADLRSAEKMRDLWMAQQQDQRQALGEIDERRLADMRSWREVPVAELRSAGAPATEPLALADLVARRRDPWARTVAERRTMRVQLAAVGQAPEVQLVAEYYAAFFDALSGRARGSSRGLLGRGPSESRLRELLQRADDALAALESGLRARADYLASWSDRAGQGGTGQREADPAVRDYLDEVERHLPRDEAR